LGKLLGQRLTQEFEDFEMSGFLKRVGFEGAKKKALKSQLINSLHPQSRQNHRGHGGVQGARAFQAAAQALQRGGGSAGTMQGFRLAE
jgi:hypothetical protein